MQTPTAAMLVIGDEILSGRTRDTNTNYLARALTDHGIQMREARVVSDTHETIKQAVQSLAASYTHVFTSGGIGPTHDDITADAVADAMGAKIDVRADARAILQVHYDARGQELNEARLRMARIPDGATLIVGGGHHGIDWCVEGRKLLRQRSGSVFRKRIEHWREPESGGVRRADLGSHSPREKAFSPRREARADVADGGGSHEDGDERHVQERGGDERRRGQGDTTGRAQDRRDCQL